VRQWWNNLWPPALATATALLLVLGVQLPASADPLPGFTLDAAQLEQRMDDCLAGAVDNKFLLMGWINVRTGEQRRWPCSSLKHMLVRTDDGAIHDPFVDVGAFMACVDRTVSYGFPRRGSGAGNTRLVYQYLGTARSASVIVDEPGDIVTIYTDPADDWTTCARWTP
jgi:hypothetical protein